MSLPLTTKGIVASLMTGGSIFGIFKALAPATVETTGTMINDLQDSSTMLSDPLEASFKASENELTATRLETFSEDSRMPPPNEEEQKMKIEEARKALERINDYSFKLFSPCGIGTGWILDYQIPENKDEYPTTWYIATNAHVIKNYRFSENPYEQKLPFAMSETNKLRWMNQEMDFSKIPLHTHSSCDAVDKYGYFELGLSRADNGEKLGARYGFIGSKKMKEARLFYLPFNFLKSSSYSYSWEEIENNYRDFAVLEIEFNSPQFAKELTNDFATKYPVESQNAINIFSQPLDSRYSWEQLESLNENFYSLAYPWQENDKYGYTVNFDEKTLEGSSLARDLFNLTGEKRVNGYVDAQKMEKRFPNVKTTWAGKSLSEVGHLYLVDKFAMIGGSSGGLYTDKDGNFLGIKRLAESKNTKHNFLVPLRSNKIEKDGVLFSPEYDLIKGGVEGQKNSYKEQVDRFIIRYKKRKTWLSERGWRHINKESPYIRISRA